MGLLKTTTAPPKTTLGGWLGVAMAVFSLLLTLGQLSEDATLGYFYASRIALFSHDGRYGVKLHFFLVFFTILDVFLVPTIIVVGLRALWHHSSTPSIEPPLGWDTEQRMRRTAQLILTLALAAVWLLLVLTLLVDPQRLLPLRFIAGMAARVFRSSQSRSPRWCSMPFCPRVLSKAPSRSTRTEMTAGTSASTWVVSSFGPRLNA